jgi:hypothetical protein
MKCAEIIDILTPKLSRFGKLCVAGGAVRDELMERQPKDFDVFVLWPNEWKFKAAKEQLTAALEGISTAQPTVSWHNSEPFLVSNLVINGADVQVLANPAQSMRDLVATFDWNVCLFGYDGDYYRGEPIENIAPAKELRLNRVTYPLSTLRRGFRFSERFKMKLRDEDIKRLCGDILKPKLN